MPQLVSFKMNDCSIPDLCHGKSSDMSILWLFLCVISFVVVVVVESRISQLFLPGVKSVRFSHSSFCTSISYGCWVGSSTAASYFSDFVCFICFLTHNSFFRSTGSCIVGEVMVMTVEANMPGSGHGTRYDETTLLSMSRFTLLVSFEFWWKFDCRFLQWDEPINTIHSPRTSRWPVSRLRSLAFPWSESSNQVSFLLAGRTKEYDLLFMHAFG